MALSVGTRLGPYEVLAPLGSGGMGEVYRATDTRLDRTVAIKILSSPLSSNTDLKQRFEREARAISSLNHPHICGLYDVGSQGGTDFLVMEFLEGETLAHRLNKGPLPIDQMLRFGMQIADALDKAHRKGIIHRDLKPGNIMLTKSGVKLLDFGLAKLRPSDSSLDQSSLSHLATEAKEITKEGTILGTIQYMSPEQLEGKETDARTDIFALGSVLYEMATGKKVFSGSSQASLMSAILKDEPIPISQVQPLAPFALDRVVKTCLAKDPEDRWQNAHDVATELKWIAEQAPGNSSARERSLHQTRASRLSWIISTALLLISTVALLYALYSKRASEEKLSIFSISPPSGYTIHSGVDGPSFAISPDGRKLTFIGADKEGRLFLWLRDFGNAEPRKLTPLYEDLFEPFWSSDSRSIGIVSKQKLSRIELDGSPSKVICDTPRLLGGTWKQDLIIFANREGLFKVSANGGAPTLILKSDPSRQETVSWPYFLPDGHHFLYAADSSVADASGIYVGSIESKERKRILPNVSRVEYSFPGYLILTEGDSLIAAPFDAAKLEVKGRALPIVQHEFQGGSFSVSDQRLLAYSSTGFWSRQLVWLDRSGRRISYLGDMGTYGEPAFSPDEKKIVLFRRNPDRFDILDLWQIDSSQGGSSRFTFNSSSTWQTGTPVWSPDGKNIVYSSGQGPQIDLFLKAADGSKKEELLFGSPTRKFVDSWSYDGHYIVYFEVVSMKMGYDLSIFSMDDRKPRPYLQTPFDENHAAISPDGQRIAYTSNETGRSEVYVRTFPDPNQGKWQISTSGGDQARWRRDGKELFFMTPDKRLIAVEILPGKNFEPGAQTVLFRASVEYNDQNRDRNQYLVSADGQRFLLVSIETSEQPALINVVLNWPLLFNTKK